MESSGTRTETMLPHPRFKMSTRGAEWAVAPGGTEALPELGTNHTFACYNPVV